MAILLKNQGYGNEDWYLHLKQQLPMMSKHIYPEIDEITYALVWDHPLGDLKNYKRFSH